jgi:hypothetical protein
LPVSAFLHPIKLISLRVSPPGGQGKKMGMTLNNALLCLCIICVSMRDQRENCICIAFEKSALYKSVIAKAIP